MERSIWLIGWKTTFTRLFLLFSFLLWPEPTLGTNLHEVCVKHAFSEPITECHGLTDEIEQHKVYLCKMQKSIDKAMTSLVRYSEDYQEVLDILYKANGSYRAIEINGVGNDTTVLAAPLPITEDMGSNGKKLSKLDSWTSKMRKSTQDGVNHSFEFLLLGCYLGFMVIFFSTFIIWVERKKLDLIEFEDCHKDGKEDSRPLNNIQATAQTGNRDQEKLVSSLAGSMSSVKLPPVCTLGKFDCDEYVYSGHFSNRSLHGAACKSPMPVNDLWYREHPSSLMPDIPNISTIGFSEPDTSKCIIFSPEYIETFMGTDYCKDSKNLKQLSANNETCRLELLVNDTYVSTDTCLKKCQMKVPSDSEGTSVEDSICTKSITSSYRIQSRSLSDRKTSLHTSSLSSNVPSGQTREMKESPVKKYDSIFENIVEESHSETENLSESEKKQPLQILSLYQQHIDRDMKSRDITEHEGWESKQQEKDEGNVDFSDFESNCVTDSEDDSQMTLQSGKVDAYSRNIKESHRSRSTTNNAGYINVVENHSLITLEEFDKAHYVQENSDRQIPVENANLLKEKENTYPSCLKGNIYVENMKENYSLEDMKVFTNLQSEGEHTNSGKTMVKSQNFQKSANIIEESASFQDCRQTTKSANFKADSNDLNVNVHAFPQNAEENADMQNVQEKTNLHNEEESSNLQKVKVDMYSENIKGKFYAHVNKDGHCHIDKGNDMCLTSLNPPTGANEDKSVPMKEKFFINVQTKQLDSAETKVEARISCWGTSEFEYVQKDYFNVIVNAPSQNVEENADMQNVQEKRCSRNVQESPYLQKVKVDMHLQSVKGNDNVHVKKDSNCHIHKGKEGCLTHSNGPTGENEDKSVSVSEKHFINGKANLVDIDVPKLEISEVEDTSRISYCMIDLRGNKSLYNGDTTPVSFGIQEFKGADSKFNEKMKETEQHCNDMEELCKSNKEDRRTLFLDENIQAVVDDGTIERGYVGNMQNNIFNEETDTMIANDTLNVGIAPSVENVSDKPVPLKVLREEDQKIELISSFREKFSALENLRHNIICLYKPLFELKPDLSLLFPWKMRTFQISTVFKDDPINEKNVKKEIICTNKDYIVSMLTDTIEEDITWTNKKCIKLRDTSSVVLNEGQEVPSQSSISEDEGFSEKRVQMVSKSYTLDKVEEEDMSLIRLNKERNLQGNNAQLTNLNTKEEDGKLHVNGSSEETGKESIEDDIIRSKDEIKVQDNLPVILDEVVKASGRSTISEDEGFSSESLEMDIKCCSQENVQVENVSWNKPNGERNSKQGFSSESFEKDSKCFNVEDKQSQTQHAVKQKIGHTEPDSTGEKVKCGAPPYLCSPKQVADTVGCTQPCLTSNFKTDNKERDPGFKMIKYGSARGPNSRVGDLSENMINEFDVKLKKKLGNECHQEQNPSLGLWMKIPSVACGLKSVSHQRLEKSADFQKKHRYLSRLKYKRNSDSNRVNIDLVSYKTDESDSGLLHTAEHKTKDCRNAICKAQRKPWTKKTHRDHSYITGESSFLKNQQKNLFGNVRKLPHFLRNHDSLFPFLQSPQRNSDLDKDAKLKSAIRKRRLRQSHLYTTNEQCSSFDKPSNGGFKMQQGLPKPIKLETDGTKMKSRIILYGSIKWTKKKRHITRSERWTSYDRSLLKLGDKSDTGENSSFESSSTDILEQNLRPELDQVILQTVGESIDSGLGTIESYRSDVVLQMETLEGAFHNNEVKLSSKKLKKLQKKLRKKESKIELPAGYINAVFDPLFFRPELSSVIVYPGLQRYFERLQEDPPSHEESLSYEWLRLQSLRNYHGAGSIVRLAQGGFYHDPVDGQLSTRCYACNVLYTNWEYFDNVTEVHRRLSPNCPHLRENASVSGNVSIDDGPVNNHPNRTGSSVSVETPEDRANESDSQSATTVNSITDAFRGSRIRDIDIVAEGFPQQPTEGRLNTEYGRSFPSHSATGPEVNLNTGPRTDRNSAHQSGNAENGRDVNDTGTSVKSASSAQTSQQTETVVQGLNNPNLVHVTNPKYREYATIDSRTTSFTSMWPSYLDQTPQQMADAGFFYTGVADFTRCFACGGDLRNWEAGPSANVNQTLSLYPFTTQPRVLRTLRKRHFGNIVGKVENAGDDPCFEHARWYPRCEYINKLKGSRYIEAVTRPQEQHRAEQENAEQQAQGRQDIKSLKAENEKLKEKLRCKICLENPLNVVLLPCGHFVCCEFCAGLLSTCPICRCRIEIAVKIEDEYFGYVR